MALLRIDPNSEVHFWLNDETPQCTLNVHHVDPTEGPVAYRIQPSQRHKYAIYPSYGVVQPKSQTSISIVLLEHATSDLKELFQKQGPLAEFRQMDKIIVEWCVAPSQLYDLLCGVEDQDFEILSSFWNTNGYEFSAPVISVKHPLRVRFSVDNDVAPAHTILQTVSMDGSSSQEEGSKDDSFLTTKSCPPRHSPFRNRQLRRRRDYTSGSSIQMPQQRHVIESPPTKKLEQSALIQATRDGVIHKYQLQQTLRCGQCYQVHSRDLADDTIPIMSQTCCHSICRGCVLSRAKRKATIGINGVSCPLCQASNAFGEELHINHSLINVIALLDS